MTLSRRDFLAAAGAGTVGALVGTAWGATQAVDPVTSVDNPLRSYPDRDWEQVYHDVYDYDEVDWTVCHPNCTQSCALNFYVKNGVPIRAEQVYHNEDPSVGPSGYEDANVSQHWNPRGCMKGLTLHRRTFEPSRIKYPMVRKGWDPGDPSPAGRGEDEFERVSWEEAVDLVAEKTASLEDNKRFHIFNAIKADGLFTRHGAGRRLASIFGGCEWTEYDWYADLPPGHVMTTGYQTSDADASAWRATEALESVATDEREPTAEIRETFEEARRRRRNADVFRDGVAAAHAAGRIDDEDIVAAVERSEFDPTTVAGREDALERVTDVYDFDYRPYGGTLFDADDGSDVDPDVPAAF